MKPSVNPMRAWPIATVLIVLVLGVAGGTVVVRTQTFSRQRIALRADAGQSNPVAPADKRKPKLVVEQEEFHFGRTETNGTGRHEFRLTNAGTGPLVLSQGRSSSMTSRGEDRCSSMELLRFTTVGSVDDGKSTLVGRLMYDTKTIFEDQLEAVERTSRQRGDEHVDLALLTDGLRAEREQGITIDVAYRYFATPKRKFIIADTPGHIQYTRNMVTGASTANLAILLVDARNGVIEQTCRHSVPNRRAAWREFRTWANHNFPVSLPEDTGDACLVVFESDWTPRLLYGQWTESEKAWYENPNVWATIVDRLQSTTEKR